MGSLFATVPTQPTCLQITRIIHYVRLKITWTYSFAYIIPGESLVKSG